MATLVIVESEAKAKALREQSNGACEPLLVRSAPMTVIYNPAAAKLWTGETGFQFVPTEGGRQVAGALLASLDKDIYLGFDSDQRGELWSWMLNGFLFAATRGQKSARRIHLSGLTADELAASFHLVEPVNAARAAALYIRSLFNNCLTGHISRLIGTGAGPGGLPLTFSSLTILFLLDERKRECAEPNMATHWGIEVRLAGPGGVFSARLREVYGISDDGLLKDAAEAKRTVALFEGQPCVVEQLGSEPFQVEPPVPYRLAELLEDGHVLIGMGPVEVARTLWKFYHGIEINGRWTGLVSNPLAESGCQASAVLALIRAEVEKRFGSACLVAREMAGQGILPLLPELTGEALPEVVSPAERRLYELIRSRALASQMGAVSGKMISVTCAGGGGCLFVGSAPLVEEQGFLRCFHAGVSAPLLDPCPLVGLAPGLNVRVEQIIPEQSAGSKPTTSSFAVLFDDLADFAMPADPSLMLLLQQMIDREYLGIDAAGAFYLKDNASKVLAALNRAFPAMKGINLSAYFEQTVNEVISGRKKLDFALKQFDQNFIMHGVPQVRVRIPTSVPLPQKRSKNIIKSPGQDAKDEATVESLGPLGTEEAQPSIPSAGDVNEAVITEQTQDADGEVVSEVEAIGADETMNTDAVPEPDAAELGESLSSPNEQMAGAVPVEPAEQQANDAAGGDDALMDVAGHERGEKEAERPAAATAEESAAIAAEIPADLAGPMAAPDQPQPVVEGEGASGRCPVCGREMVIQRDSFGPYLACSGAPACRHSEPLPSQTDAGGVICPLCRTAPLVVKPTATGKQLHVCTGPGCEFMAWSRPHAVGCPECGSPFLVEKREANGRVALRCPRAGCRYVEPQDGKEESDGEEDPKARKKKILVRRRKGSAPGAVTKKVVVRRVKR
ncbi:MAG: topoisomerase DNA-binding C4 zinc finger domain-containing protein [Thermodesulfobacteriota bacterium]